MTFVIILCHLILLSLPCCSLGLPHPLAVQLKAMRMLKPVVIKLPVSQQEFKSVISGSWGNLDYHLPRLLHSCSFLALLLALSRLLNATIYCHHLCLWVLLANLDSNCGRSGFTILPLLIALPKNQKLPHFCKTKVFSFSGFFHHNNKLFRVKWCNRLWVN